MRIPVRLHSAAFVVALALAVTTGVAKETSSDHPEVLTNGDIVDLVKAGLSEKAVLSKITASEVSFDTSTDAIIALKKAGVTDNVIAEMIVRQRDGSRVEKAPESEESNPLLRAYEQRGSRRGAELRAGGKSYQLEGVRPTNRFVHAFVTALWFRRIGGEQASVRINDKKPVIVLPRRSGGVATNAAGVFLVKLDVDHEEGAREFEVDGAGPFSTGVVMEPDEDNLQSVTADDVGEEIQITPKKSLQPGEYALVDDVGFAYPFGVD